MMLAKYIDIHTIKRPTNPIREGGKVYSNPTEETLRALGYTDVIVDPMPEVPQGKVAMPRYTDGAVIRQGWEIVDEPEI